MVERSKRCIVIARGSPNIASAKSVESAAVLRRLRYENRQELGRREREFSGSSITPVEKAYRITFSALNWKSLAP